MTLQPSDVRGQVKAGTTPVTGTVELVTSGPDFETITSKVKAKYGLMVPIKPADGPFATPGQRPLSLCGHRRGDHAPGLIPAATAGGHLLDRHVPGCRRCHWRASVFVADDGERENFHRSARALPATRGHAARPTVVTTSQVRDSLHDFAVPPGVVPGSWLASAVTWLESRCSGNAPTCESGRRESNPHDQLGRVVTDPGRPIQFASVTSRFGIFTLKWSLFG